MLLLAVLIISSCLKPFLMQTTPVCEQTCGNGGKLLYSLFKIPYYDTRFHIETKHLISCTNFMTLTYSGNCTSSNTCTCPSDWTGDDCRTPMCEQDCSNGGSCVAPNTCQCPPDWSGHDCTLPVCHQGFFVPYHELPEWMVEPTTKRHWLQYQPCNFSSWCNTTQGFDCAQADRESSPATPLFGMDWRCVYSTISLLSDCCCA